MERILQLLKMRMVPYGIIVIGTDGSHGSYEMAATFNPGFDDIGIPEPVKRKTTGQMGVWAFLKHESNVR